MFSAIRTSRGNDAERADGLQIGRARLCRADRARLDRVSPYQDGPRLIATEIAITGSTSMSTRKEKSSEATPLGSRACLPGLGRVGQRLDRHPPAGSFLRHFLKRRAVLSISRLHPRQPDGFTPERAPCDPGAGRHERAFDQRRPIFHKLPASRQQGRRPDLGDGCQQNSRARASAEPNS